MDIGQIEKLMQLMQAYGFQELGWEKGEESIHLVQSQAPQAPLAHLPSAPAYYPYQASKPQGTGVETQTSSVQEVKKERKGTEVRSPFVGTFYGSASPGSDPFVSVGSRVKKGDTLCIIEAMKLMNEIEAEKDGVIVEILAKNETPVEFDQPLFLME